MAPFALILLGIVIYLVNQQPDVHVGFRGLPWLDAPMALVVAGLVVGVVQIEARRRRGGRVVTRRGEHRSQTIGQAPVSRGENSADGGEIERPGEGAGS